MNKRPFLKLPKDKMNVLHRAALERKGGYLWVPSSCKNVVEDVGEDVNPTIIALRGGASAPWLWGLSNYISGVFL